MLDENQHAECRRYRAERDHLRARPREGRLVEGPRWSRRAQEPNELGIGVSIVEKPSGRAHGNLPFRDARRDAAFASSARAAASREYTVPTGVPITFAISGAV